MGPPTRSHTKLAAAAPWPPSRSRPPHEIQTRGDNYVDRRRLYRGTDLRQRFALVTPPF